MFAGLVADHDADAGLGSIAGLSVCAIGVHNAGERARCLATLSGAIACAEIASFAHLKEAIAANSARRLASAAFAFERRVCRIARHAILRGIGRRIAHMGGVAGRFVANGRCRTISRGVHAGELARIAAIAIDDVAIIAILTRVDHGIAAGACANTRDALGKITANIALCQRGTTRMRCEITFLTDTNVIDRAIRIRRAGEFTRITAIAIDDVPVVAFFCSARESVAAGVGYADAIVAAIAGLAAYGSVIRRLSRLAFMVSAARLLAIAEIFVVAFRCRHIGAAK